MFSSVSSIIIIIIIIHLLLVLHMSIHTNCVCIRSNTKKKKTKLIGHSMYKIRDRTEMRGRNEDVFFVIIYATKLLGTHRKKNNRFDIISLEIERTKPNQKKKNVYRKTRNNLSFLPMANGNTFQSLERKCVPWVYYKIQMNYN